MVFFYDLCKNTITRYVQICLMLRWFNVRNYKNKIQCDMCNRKFTSDVDLMNHMQIFHGKDLKYDCRQCNKHFSSMESMRTHLQREHNYVADKNFTNNNGNNSTTPTNCNNTHNSNNSNNNTNNHTNNHTNNKKPNDVN